MQVKRVTLYTVSLKQGMSASIKQLLLRDRNKKASTRAKMWSKWTSIVADEINSTITKENSRRVLKLLVLPDE